jgi:metal-responsive CopG/Arc/MetJ family transcriptional regulator
MRATSDKTNRVKTGLSLQADLIQMCDANLQTANCRSRNEYVENAIRFYTAYLSAERDQDFLVAAVAQTVSAIISNTENRIARMQFKEAVELAKLTHMVAPLCDLDDEQLRRLHIQCVDEVKKINGALRLDRAVEDARGGD